MISKFKHQEQFKDIKMQKNNETQPKALNTIKPFKNKTKIMKLAIVGATGMVGNVMLKVLEEGNLPFTELLLVASERNIGKTIQFKINTIKCISNIKRFLIINC